MHGRPKLPVVIAALAALVGGSQAAAETDAARVKPPARPVPVVIVLRRAGLFTDPGADTATDPVLRRDTLVDLLRPVLARGVRVGLTCANFIDHASTRLLRAFADTARLAVEHGLDASGLVLGTVGRLPPELRLEQAELRDVPGPPADSIRLTDDMQGVLSLVAAAPHPVNAS